MHRISILFLWIIAIALSAVAEDYMTRWRRATASSQPCDCEPPVHYADDLCVVHREAYDNYCWETAPEDRMSVTVWFDRYTRSLDRSHVQEAAGISAGRQP